MFIVIYFVVIVGECCCQYDKIDNVCCGGDVDFCEGEYKGVVVVVNFILWENGDDYENCVNIKNQDMLQYFIYCVM